MRIFVSRSLIEESPLRASAKGHDIIDASLIKFAPLSFDTPESDWVFFYSRNGVRFFFEQDSFSFHPFLWACLSEGTADELSRYVTDISFVGKGGSEAIVEQFEKIRRPGETVCFIRAEQSADSVLKLTTHKEDFSLPVYKNEPIEELPNGPFDIMIFTSSLNAKTWYGRHSYKGERVIAIGEPTRQTLLDLGVQHVCKAEESSEFSMAKELDKVLSD